MENQNKKLLLIKDLGISYPNENSKRQRRYGLYKCFCGNEFKTIIESVKFKNTKSCGCLKIKHNLYKHRLYIIRIGMINRCNSKKEYVLKNITICDEWKNDFMSFYNWALKNGYQDGLSIDRINNDGNYEPSNCRWTTKNVQQRNTRKLQSTNTSGYRGVHWHKRSNKWISQIGVDNKRIHLGSFNDAIGAAIAYDKYIVDNNLEHTRNFS